MSIPEPLYWQGRPITELTKEELLEVLAELAAENKKLLQTQRTGQDVAAAFARATKSRG